MNEQERREAYQKAVQMFAYGPAELPAADTAGVLRQFRELNIVEDGTRMLLKDRPDLRQEIAKNHAEQEIANFELHRPDIVLVVEGGIIQEAYSRTNIRFTVIDMDGFEESDEIEIGGMRPPDDNLEGDGLRECIDKVHGLIHRNIMEMQQ